MNWFKNLNISRKIIMGYIIIALITAVTGYIGIKNVHQLADMDKELYIVNTKPIEEIGKASIQFQKTRVAMRIILDTENPDIIKQELDMIDSLGTLIDNNLSKFKESIEKEEIRVEYESLISKLNEYDNVVSQFRSVVQSGQTDEAVALLDSPQTKDILESIEETVDTIYDMKINDASVKEKENQLVANTASTFIGLAIIIAFILSIAIGVVISRIISKPLIQFSQEFDKLSNGNVDIDISVDTKDEIGDLSRSLNDIVGYIKDKVYVTNKVAEGDLGVEIDIRSEEDVLSQSIGKLSTNIQLIMSELQYMAKEHNLGDIDVLIDEDKFEGAYKEVAVGINAMVKEHIGAKRQAMDCIDEFAKGNFDAEIEDFPGKKVFINHTIERMRKNLRDVTNEVDDLVRSANEGKLSDRADVGSYQGDWSVLMTGLNNLIDGILEPINEAAIVLEEMSKGNLSAKVEGDYKGDHARIKDSLNNTIDILHAYIGEISYTLKQISNHDLTMVIDRDYVGEFGNIKTSLNLIIDSLNEVMGEINFASEQVSGGAQQVSDSSQALSQGSAEQASSVEEITASIEQVAVQTKQNALNANNANDLAIKARDEATEGNKHMNEMVKSMEDINESSSNISRIIKVIDDIAFQTNILALNAAVEAARAGQHGKGFAVVAEEVRNLAARSADAARETTDMIEDSIKTTEAGTGIAYQTAKSLEEILEGVSDVSNLVSDIASASNEQATAVSQVNQAIDQVSTVTQMNTSTSEESASASEQLSGQAEMLKEMVGKFRLKGQYKSKSNKIIKSYDSNYENEEYNDLDRNNKYEDIEISLDDTEFGKYS